MNTPCPTPPQHRPTSRHIVAAASLRRGAVVACALVSAGVACTPRRTVPAIAAPTPHPVDVPPTFPPIARITAPVALRVTYPPAGATVAARDSNFIFGTVGTGDATLTINGRPVEVLPNGAWLGWLPLPPRERPIYDLMVVRGTDTTRATHRIVYPAERPLLPASGPLVVDTASLSPGAPYARLASEIVPLSLRASPTARVWLRWGGDSTRHFSTALAYGLRSSPRPDVHVLDVAASVVARGDARIYAALGRDTVSLGAPPVALADTITARWVVVGGSSPDVRSESTFVIARPVVGGTYKWFIMRGTFLELTGRQGNSVRVRLAPGLDAWIDASAAQFATSRPPIARIAGNARVRAQAGYSELVIPMANIPAWSVDERDDRLDLTLYGTTANTDILNFASGDSVIRRVTWEQVGDGRAVYHVELHERSFGYVVRWERGALVLRVRRAPRVDPARPLAGLTIAVDAGHPPAGSTGPTGFYEGVATLQISERLKALLEARGARVFMTRTSDAPVDLGARQPMASNAGAHAFVSIHLNALPDGVNPFVSHGTGTYWFNASSSELARHVQRGMVRRLGLRDLGTNYDNLAVLRPSWMPSVLCEGAFIMMPDQEALLRTREFQSAYAQGVAEGVEGYFRELGEGQRAGAPGA